MKKRISYNKTGELTDILNDAMTNLKQAIDINTVVGKPIVAEDGSIIVPVSKVYVGIVAGGENLTTQQQKRMCLIILLQVAQALASQFRQLVFNNKKQRNNIHKHWNG